MAYFKLVVVRMTFSVARIHRLPAQPAKSHCNLFPSIRCRPNPVKEMRTKWLSDHPWVLSSNSRYMYIYNSMHVILALCFSG